MEKVYDCNYFLKILTNFIFNPSGTPRNGKLRRSPTRRLGTHPKDIRRTLRRQLVQPIRAGRVQEGPRALDRSRGRRHLHEAHGQDARHRQAGHPRHHPAVEGSPGHAEASRFKEK